MFALEDPHVPVGVVPGTHEDKSLKWEPLGLKTGPTRGSGDVVSFSLRLPLRILETSGALYLRKERFNSVE